MYVYSDEHNTVSQRNEMVVAAKLSLTRSLLNILVYIVPR